MNTDAVTKGQTLWYVDHYWARRAEEVRVVAVRRYKPRKSWEQGAVHVTVVRTEPQKEWTREKPFKPSDDELYPTKAEALIVVAEKLRQKIADARRDITWKRKSIREDEKREREIRDEIGRLGIVRAESA